MTENTGSIMPHEVVLSELEEMFAHRPYNPLFGITPRNTRFEVLMGYFGEMKIPQEELPSAIIRLRELQKFNVMNLLFSELIRKLELEIV